ncbi:hypothetical protein DT351_11055 (plasmid) [Latilactobacillus curvatus]|mgnify:CR=1|uniref:Uncharacterized protein n=1 Tax=Latilactobacillus curvatus TaxID=28038 RepID=A0A385AGQ0_LATCU|nr:hypothetical protein [Latilactobacillus curvatus]AXN36879.1 hypothetical protein DT351_11055 [Latilactobacillus curvatus]
MRTAYDEFNRLPVAKMAQSIADMTFAYKQTRVPSKHYKDLLGKPLAEMVEDSVSINLLNTYFKTLKTLLDENPKWFMQALLCLDLKITPANIKAEELQALELTFAKFQEQKAKHVATEYIELFQNIRDNGAQSFMESGDLN